MPGLPSRFRLNGRLVEPAANRVTAGCDVAQVEPKIMSVLVALAEMQGEVVTREALMGRVWPDVFVTEDVLHRAIRELRRLFGDDSGAPRVIETIRKRGYRLIAPIEPLTETGRAGELVRLKPDSTETGRLQPNQSRRIVTITLSVAAVAAAITAVLWIGARAPLRSAEPLRFIPLTNAPGNEVDPALSPSGTLAYVAAAADRRNHLFVKAPGDPQGVQLTGGNGRELAPTWSPDDRQIAFVRATADGDCGIWTIDAVRRAERRVGPCLTRASMKMSWSPDGRSLAVAAGAGGPDAPLRLELLSLATGSHRAITEPPAGSAGDDVPAFSPDGRQIAFVRSLSGAIGDVYIVDATGGAARRVTADDGDIMGVDWEPDGTHLVFSSERGGGISLWRVASAGGEPTFLAGGGAKLKHPAVARRTGAVAFEDWHYEINLAELPTAAGTAAATPAPIAPTSDQWNFHPQISPDGSRLAFQSTRSGQYEIWVANRDGTNARQLTRSGSYKSPPRWSSDGRRLVFATRTAETPQLIALDVENGAASALPADADAVLFPSWSHDGRIVYFGALRSGAWRVSSAGLAGARALQVVPGAWAAADSPDGRWLYYVRLDRRGLWRRSLSGSGDRIVSDRFQAEDWANLSIADRGVFFVARPDAGDPQLTFVDPETGSFTALTRLPEFAWSGIAVSRDGSRVLYAHADRRDANIVEIAGR